MTKLVDLYEDVRGVNALVQLDCFAGLASSMLQSNRMESIQKLFAAHLFPLKP